MIKEKLNGIKNTIVNNPSFTLKEQLGYAGGIFGNCMGQDSTQTFSEQFSRDYQGINNDRMTIMGNVLTAVGLIATPVAGNFLDKPTEEGRLPSSKKFLKYTPIPFAIASMLLFIVPSATNLFFNFIWTLVLRCVFQGVDAFYDSSLSTLSLRMTNNPKDRKNFYTVSTLASSLGSMLPGWIIPIVVDKMPTAEAEKKAFFFVALAFCIISLPLLFAPYFTLNEKIKVTDAPNDGKNLIQWDSCTVKALLHNKPFVVLEIGTFFETIRQISYSLLNYIYKKTFDDYSMKAIIDIISGVLSYAGLGAVPVLGRKFSARTVTSGGFVYTGFFYGIMSIMPLFFNLKTRGGLDKFRKFRYLIGVLIGLAGMPNNAISASKKIIVGDSTDYMEWYSEKQFARPIHSEGLITATQGICNTVFSFFKTNLYNILFKKIGYKENKIDNITGETIEVTQSLSTLKGLYIMFALCGLIGNVCAAVTYLFDNYTGERREKIYAELCEIRAAKQELTDRFITETEE